MALKFSRDSERARKILHLSMLEKEISLMRDVSLSPVVFITYLQTVVDCGARERLVSQQRSVRHQQHHTECLNETP